MASTTFVDRQTPILAAWLNDVDSVVYNTTNVKTAGAAVNGTTDDSTIVQAQIDSMYAAGGGTLIIPGICAIGTTITLKSRVSVYFTKGGYFKWIGSTSGICVRTDPTIVVQDCVWSNLKINTGSSFTGTALDIHSAHNIFADKITLVTTGTTSKAIKMIADSSGGESATTKRNITACKFDAIIQQGQCGTLIEFDGVTSGYDSNPQVVTLNDFGNIFAEDCAVYGINFKNWVDNNTFSGTTRISITANNAVGVQVGSATSAGVYMNSFNLLAVDTFSTLTGRVGIKVDNSKLTKVTSFYQHPVAEGGSFVSTAAAESYDVSLFVDADKTIIKYQRLVSNASEGFNSSRTITIADDTAGSINVAEGGIDQNITFILTVATTDANANGVAWLKCRRSSGTAAITAMVSGANFAVTTGALTGTTGTDTKLTVSAHNDGKFYIENRLGTTIYLTTHVAAWMQTP